MCAMTRPVLIVGSVVAGLLVAVVVLLGVLIWQNDRAAKQERYDRARETCEELIGRPSADNLDDFAACADRLLP